MESLLIYAIKTEQSPKILLLALNTIESVFKKAGDP